MWKKKKNIEKWNAHLQNLDAFDILRWGIQTFGKTRIAFASSIGVEDQVITHMIMSIDKNVRIFTIDTGRMFQEVYFTIEKTENRYDFKYEIYFPDYRQVEKMVNEKGINLFYNSIENRKLCCHVRKVEPLRRALRGVKCWICGLRREQSLTRENIQPIEWDEVNGLYKLNPLYNWTTEKVWQFIKEHKIPYNKLHDQGYPSIGCMPCTRAIKEGEDIRSGRWWWENPEHKECGLHRR
ncbi:phosphoadenylyl-sulfate reductase [Thermospira aquatica]|uniref:Adenosine 5'-phosphosulfate reductase n=1 Tax=Thermospira aquatica TaxID=2828656 RepID=A0AAX3BAF1_9SPIR|nr:phosphoadenylyl-sulfate reductase [Thermospira aquatica]URA09230.1 phosphoadenylyl-sulfate reductase [Thermospira aquatica]